MRKCANNSPYMRRPLVIYDSATALFWISLYMMEKYIFFFISVASLDCPAAYGAVLAGGGGGAGGMQVGCARHRAVVRQAAHLLPVVPVNNDPAARLRGVHVLLCHLKPVPLYSTVYGHTIHEIGSGVLVLANANLCRLMLSELSTNKFACFS